MMQHSGVSERTSAALFQQLLDDGLSPEEAADKVNKSARRLRKKRR